MPMTAVAMLSMHTSPLAQPGTGDSGGMNVYVRELAASLAQAGVRTTVYVRRWTADLPERVLVEPLMEVVHVPVGPIDAPKEALPDLVDGFAEWVGADLVDGRHLRLRAPGRRGADRRESYRLLDTSTAENPRTVLHANYWLSAVAGHRLKHGLGLPLVTTFHTLARVKAVGGDPEPSRRERAEQAVIGCSDVVCASSRAEARQIVGLYDAPADRIEIVPPGVDHAFFSPGDRRGARAALGLGEGPVLLFVGRIQPLKGLDVAVEALARLAPEVTLLAVGGPSGPEGPVELERIRDRIHRLGLGDRVRFVDPQPHHLLSTYYRAADLTLVPSRSESFGLVAAESAACGTPVVAAAVGGLTSLVVDGVTGRLLDERHPSAWASAIASLLDDPARRREMAHAAFLDANRYRWATSAARLRRIYSDLTIAGADSATALVDCDALR
ncbi:MAG: glycosyltransferase [Microthrixaceae bacterium]